MAMSETIGQEKQRIAERLARLDTERTKLAEQLNELEVAERVLSRFGGAQAANRSFVCPPSVAMIVGTTPMIAIPGAAFMHPVAMIVGTAPQNCCNDFGYGCPMIAIPAADDCGSLQLSMVIDERRTTQRRSSAIHQGRGGSSGLSPQRPCREFLASIPLGPGTRSTDFRPKFRTYSEP
jgi:hypothetical protein